MTNELIFRLPKSYFIVLITLTVFIFSIALFLLLEDGITETFFFVFPWLAISLLLTILIRRWKLTLKDKQIIHTPSFGKTKSFTFSDITKIKRGTEHWDYEDYEYIEAYRGKEMLFCVNNRCKAFKVLVSLLESEGVHIEDKSK